MIGAVDILKKRQEENDSSVRELLSEERRLQRQMQGFKQQQISLYENYRDGKLAKEEFLYRKAETRTEAKKLK